MDDWDLEVEQVPSFLSKEPMLSRNWEDEDVDDNEIKDSWDQVDDEPSSMPPSPKPHTENLTKKPSENKGKVLEVEKEDEPLLDPLAEKLRQQKLVEEADFKATKELFFTKKHDEKSLDNFIPKSESDFLEYAQLVSHKLRPYEKSYHYIGLLKAVMRLSMASLKGAEAKDVASLISAIANEKVKAEKEAVEGKKKTGAKKKQLYVDKVDEDVVANGYDHTDDYDFLCETSVVYFLSK